MIIVAIGVLRAMCISLPYQFGICEVTESTEQKNPEKKKHEGRLFMAWMLLELPTMLRVIICKINK